MVNGLGEQNKVLEVPIIHASWHKDICYNSELCYDSNDLGGEAAGYIRNTGQLPASFRELRFVDGGRTIQRVGLAVSQAGQTEKLQRLGPMRRSLFLCKYGLISIYQGKGESTIPTLEDLLLLLEFLLGSGRNGSVASVDTHPVLIACGRAVVVRCSAVPCE